MHDLLECGDCKNPATPQITADQGDGIGERPGRLADPIGFQIIAVAYGKRGAPQRDHRVEAEQARFGTQHGV